LDNGAPPTLCETAKYFAIRTTELVGVAPTSVYHPPWKGDTNDVNSVCIDYDDAQISLRANARTAELLVTASTKRQDMFSLDDEGKNDCLFYVLVLIRLGYQALEQCRGVQDRRPKEKRQQALEPQVGRDVTT
jgi:hypothetical protein